jgi:hypothetical protein
VTARQLLAAAQAAGIRLAARHDRLVYDAPPGTLTPALRAALTREKPALLALLTPVPVVTLLGGLTVPAPALKFALDLEARGIPLATDCEHRFIIPNDERLTPEDRSAVLRWQVHLGALAEYRAPEA